MEEKGSQERTANECPSPQAYLNLMEEKGSQGQTTSTECLSSQA